MVDKSILDKVILDARRGQRRTTVRSHGQKKWKGYLGVPYFFPLESYVSLFFEDRFSARFFLI